MMMMRRRDEEEDEDVRINVNLSEVEFKKTLIKDFWLCSDNDIDLRLAQLEDLMNRRPELVYSVALRQNPHNVEQWHRRVKLFEGNPAKQVLMYVEALKTVEPMLAVGKPHTLWVAFAKLYETQGDIANARVVFETAVQANYKDVDDLACVWCESAEMELRNKNSRRSRELMSVATAEPSAEVKRRAKAAGGNEPVQMKLYKSSRLWTLYVALEESFGTLGSTREVYERMLDLRIVTPQIIINYASLLEEHKYFEEAFKVYEKGTQMFKYPHVKDIWVTYLSKFVKRYGRTRMERARELFEHAIKAAPADAKKPLYLQFAKMEEDYGLAKRVMEVYHAAVEAVPEHDKLSMYEIYIARAAERFGVSKTREIYVQAIKSGLPHKDVKTMCLKYAELEKSLGEIDRARRVYMYGSQLSHPNYDVDLWNKWLEFEVQHGNEDTFRDMLRIKRTVSASYSQTDSTVMQKDQRLSIGGEIKVSAGYHEDIELPEEETDYENEKMVEIAQKDVPFSVSGHMANKRKKPEDDSPQSPFGALGRIQIEAKTSSSLNCSSVIKFVS
ncbi:hypothetical protein ACLB2K_024824 [Fragaria x ananassa]